MNLASMEPGILLPAFIAGLLVLASHVPLGQAVLRRGIVFLDLAIAQIAGLGVVLAHSLGGEDNVWLTQAGAVTAALLGALLLRFTERVAGARQEAIIGEAFVGAASGMLILISQDPHGAEHLQDLLVGQILWTTWGGLLPLAGVTALMLVAWFMLNLRASPLGFYLLFALAITASVQMVGIYLVFASLIVPALAFGHGLARGYGLGAAGYALGLALSGLFDLPAGAAIVLALIGVALLLKGVAQLSSSGQASSK
jgi:zinc/manganese transport system permease protein